jgi:3-hydroxyisobutyrate dehydrogenase-like beta-hydroxyacid dehydrogenase
MLMEQQTFGFIGVGRMGGLMSARLLEGGHKVVAYDVSEEALAVLEKKGAQRAASATEVANRVETVFLSLPNPEIVQRASLDDGGVIQGKKVKRVVDFSTIGPRTAGLVAKGLATRNMVYVDAPVSGGLKGAREGTLAVMVACPKAVYTELESILKTFGKPFHLGESAGQAQTMKLANNLLAAAAMALTSEAMVMGVKAGLNPKVMLDVLNAGSGRNSATQDKFPKSVLPGTFDFGFATGLSYKDVRLCIDEAEALGVPMVCGAVVRQMLAVTKAMYGADSDFTCMCKVVESWAGVEVRG